MVSHTEPDSRQAGLAHAVIVRIACRTTRSMGYTVVDLASTPRGPYWPTRAREQLEGPTLCTFVLASTRTRTVRVAAYRELSLQAVLTAAVSTWAVRVKSATAGPYYRSTCSTAVRDALTDIS